MSFRWGIAGTGSIAHGFADALGRLPDAHLVAVASRSREKAEEFGEKYAVPADRRYASYEDLAADDTVDLVYVASPQSHHREHTLLFLNSGHGVLCEKPFALDAAQAADMIAVARERGLFLMEAMWSRFLPAYVKLRELIAENAIGTVLSVDADFGFPFPPGGRLFDPALGGGSLLDLGVYPVSLASMLLGEPARVTATGLIGTAGVDDQIAVLSGYTNGAFSVARSSLRTQLACTARIAGTEGHIELPFLMHCPDSLTLQAKGTTETFTLPAARDGDAPETAGGGLHHQVRHLHARLTAGHLESDVIPLDETLSIMRTLDTARAEIGLVFP
ncbi:Gfo/Idh/MocA family oxidoreductase [Streptomyces sp. NPDC004539]|uniref:Gfo/Idh/MocA family protein n=1 Tax=Streptomyces sp. NPDC004539 TaxID=3154280 RepID=UPI0033B21779